MSNGCALIKNTKYGKRLTEEQIKDAFSQCNNWVGWDSHRTETQIWKEPAKTFQKNYLDGHQAMLDFILDCFDVYPKRPKRLRK